MTLPPARRWLAAVLLLAVLAPDGLPAGAAGQRCAMGMVEGCCCLRQAAMTAGDHCPLHRPEASCALRSSQDRSAEIVPGKDRAGWIGIALRDGLRLPQLASGASARLDASPPDLPRPSPPVPPPRPVPAV